MCRIPDDLSQPILAQAWRQTYNDSYQTLETQQSTQPSNLKELQGTPTLEIEAQCSMDSTFFKTTDTCTKLLTLSVYKPTQSRKPTQPAFSPLLFSGIPSAKRSAISRSANTKCHYFFVDIFIKMIRLPQLAFYEYGKIFILHKKEECCNCNLY